MAIPADDLARALAVSHPDRADAVHLAVAGNTYTILISGEQTAGRHCLIDMHVPDGGGPPPHRHDFEEMYAVLEGEVAFTFRGETMVVPAGTTLNIPANAPHRFQNVSGRVARMLCLCAPAGQDAFFLEIGDRVASRTAPAPAMSAEQKAARAEKAQSLAVRYRTEMLPA